ncbi:hypothetical protein FACS1894116_13770 [Betaproteobacteria bacterium]|nr:hypothetical protein FACS1894116_13770 [Betaproteobacteria bacterium]GHU26040.1 hypothetical protein FACS189488_13990 [Betaproteobacteria bacterium]GHU32318.1 hypothetical protein FACS189497_13850 [Betaproteobacteria bacterium]
MPPFLSVIIPAYNAAGTIGRCLETLDRALSETRHEILVVDDASSDNTARQVEKLAKKLPAVRLVRHSRNQGPGPARNSGLSEARGEFIWFVDADDEIPLAGFAGLDARAATAGCDVLLFKYNRVDSRTRQYSPWLDYDARVFAGRPGDDFSAREFPPVLATSHALWNKWFRRESVMAAGMPFPATITSQDLPFTIANLYAARRLRYLDRILYTYREDASRLSRISDARRLGVLSVCEITENWLLQAGVDRECLTAFHVCKAHILLLNYKNTDKQTQERLRESLDGYLKSLSMEMALRLAGNVWLRQDVKNRMLILHGLNPGITAKALARYSACKKALRAFYLTITLQLKRN